MNPFVSVDVETANPYEKGSICQIALVMHDGSKRHTLFSSLINPNTEFSPINTRIHGISPSDVVNSPTFCEALQVIAPILQSNVLIAHNAGFDISAIEQAVHDAGGSPIEMVYGCTLKAARMILYGEMSRFRLSDLCDRFNVKQTKLHDAESDAAACADVACCLAELSNAEDVECLMQRAGHKLANSLTNSFDPDFIRPARVDRLFIVPDFASDSCDSCCGKTVVFTGELSSLFRKDAERLVVALDGIFEDSVTKRTDILVVGTQDLTRTKGMEKSSKHRKADTINNSGVRMIQIIDETEFLRLVGEG
jgi:DNA polymerase III subunit epsilon